MKHAAFTAFALIVSSVLGAAPGLAAQKNPEPRITGFDAPGADTTAGDYNGTFPTGINNRGEITGSYQDVNEVSHGFLRTCDGKFKTFDVPGADLTAGDYNGTVPEAISDLGTITGYYIDINNVSHGFLLTASGKYTAFDVPGVGNSTFAMGINLEGEVAGYYADANSAFHAFLRRADGTFVTWVGANECTGNGSVGCYGSAAFGVNIFGEVSGGYGDNSGNFIDHGLIRNADGKLIEYSDPHAGSTGPYQGTGCPGCGPAINFWGAIAGIFTDSNNVYHTFLRGPQGTFTTIDAPGAGTAANQGTGCPSDCNVGLNDFGAIAGNYLDANYVYRVFLRTPEGNYVQIDPPGSQLTSYNGLNDEETVIGYYLGADNVYHGYLSTP